jgi:peptidoglycan/LPS O-acetylase OafA/YrhL
LPQPIVAAALSANHAEAHAKYLGTRFFGSLDGLRAVSILAVVWHHTGAAAIANPLGQQGKYGVTLFFVISGYLIATLILRAKEAGNFRLGRFWGRRMLRIFPVYFAVLALYTLLTWVLERHTPYGEEFFATLPAFATFTANWVLPIENVRVIFYFAWSLAAEEQFYLVWPFLALWLPGMRPALVAVLVLLGSQYMVLEHADMLGEELPVRLGTCLPPGILLGVILAYLLHAPAGFAAAVRLAGYRWSAPAAALASLAMLAIGREFGPAEGLAVALPLTWLVAACVLREDNGLAGGLRLAPVVWIGTVSYGMYLLHMLAVNVARRVVAMAGIDNPLVDFLAGTAIALAAASVSFLWYERPFLRLKERFF